MTAAGMDLRTLALNVFRSLLNDLGAPTIAIILDFAEGKGSANIVEDLSSFAFAVISDIRATIGVAELRAEIEALHIATDVEVDTEEALARAAADAANPAKPAP